MESSRVFVSGLPPTFSNDQLKKHFSSRFNVTDAHVLPKRRIGFVGFKDPEMAKQAAGYFNRTYVKMSKISVEIARPVSSVVNRYCCCCFLSSHPLCTLTGKGGPETDQICFRSIQRLIMMLMRQQNLLVPMPQRRGKTSNGNGMRISPNMILSCKSIFL